VGNVTDKKENKKGNKQKEAVSKKLEKKRLSINHHPSAVSCNEYDIFYGHSFSNEIGKGNGLYKI
jgi:hypothetical protein